MSAGWCPSIASTRGLLYASVLPASTWTPSGSATRRMSSTTFLPTSWREWAKRTWTGALARMRARKCTYKTTHALVCLCLLLVVWEGKPRTSRGVQVRANTCTWVGLARTVYIYTDIQHIWPYIWWFACQKTYIHRIYMHIQAGTLKLQTAMACADYWSIGIGYISMHTKTYTYLHAKQCCPDCPARTQHAFGSLVCKKRCQHFKNTSTKRPECCVLLAAIAFAYHFLCLGSQLIVFGILLLLRQTTRVVQAASMSCQVPCRSAHTHTHTHTHNNIYIHTQ